MEKKILSIAGVECGDYVYYLSKLFSTKDAPVLVIDNSTTNDAYRMVTDDAAEDESYVNNITFLYNIAFHEDTIRDFDYVIVYHGATANEIWWTNSNHHLLISDFDRFHMASLRQGLSSVEKKELLLLFHNRFTSKANDRIASLFLDLPTESLQEVFEIDADSEILACKLCLQYDKSLKLSALPKAVKRTLFDIYCRIEPQDKKTKLDTIINLAG